MRIFSRKDFCGDILLMNTSEQLHFVMARYVHFTCLSSPKRNMRRSQVNSSSPK